MNKDMGSTEALMREKGHKKISGQALKQRLIGNTILGDFGFAYKYIMTIGADGSLEGINNVGSHHFGQMIIDEVADTVTVQWQDGWANNTSRAYDVDGDITLYDIATGQWSTTFTKVLSGTDYKMLPPV